MHELISGNLGYPGRGDRQLLGNRLNRSVSIGPSLPVTTAERSLLFNRLTWLTQVLKVVPTSNMAEDKEVHGDEVAKHNSRENVSQASDQ